MAGILGLSLMSDTSSENWLMESLQGEEEEEEEEEEEGGRGEEELHTA